MKLCVSTTIDFKRHTNAGPSDYLRLHSLFNGNGGDCIKRMCFSCSQEKVRKETDKDDENAEYRQQIDPAKHWHLNWNSTTVWHWFDPMKNSLLNRGKVELVCLDYYYNQAESWHEKYYSKGLITNLVPFCFLVLQAERFIVPNYSNDLTIDKFLNSFENGNNNVLITALNADGTKRTSVSRRSTFLHHNVTRLQPYTNDTKYEFVLKPIAKENSPLYIATDDNLTALQLQDRTNENMITVEAYNQMYHFVEITCRPIPMEEWNRIRK